MNDKEWVFTFCGGQRNGGCCVRITGDYKSARAKMCKIYGANWGFQYSAKEWDAMKNDPKRCWKMETEIPFGSWKDELMI